MKHTKPPRTSMGLKAGVTATVATMALSSSTALAQSISDDQAAQIALAEVAGTVVEIDREDENGVAVVEVEVRASDGSVYEVTIDASTGAVMAIDDDDDDGPDDDD